MMMVRFVLLSALLVTGLFGKAQEVPSTPPKLQNDPLDAGAQVPRVGGAVSHCHSVLLDSDDQTFTSEQLRQSVAREPDFVRNGFALSTGPQLPDAKVHLAIIKDVVRNPTVILQAWNTISHTTTQESFPWPDNNREHVISLRVIAMLSRLCGEPRSVNLQQKLSADQIAELLRSFRRVQAISHTYLTPKRLAIELGARAEIMEWGISISNSAEGADVGLVVDHLPSISWSYQLVDLKNRAPLDSGEVLALQEERAASRIADMVILHLAAFRHLKRTWPR